MDEARISGGGSGDPLLVLIHGMGATGAVWEPWRPVLARHWPGRWLAPDLPGHGAAAPLPRYSFGGLAAHLAVRLAGELARDQPVVVLGHSLGGVLGLTLATGWYGIRVDTVVGLGVKVAWSGVELAKAASLAARPVQWFASRDEAVARHLRISGLVGLAGPDDPVARTGLCRDEQGWRLAMDPAVFAVGAPDLPGLLAAARARVLLARGEHDPMVSHEQLMALHPAAVSLPGLGHNAHVEDPEAVLRLLTAALAATATLPDQVRPLID